eukprot:gene15784-21908_t
MLTYEHYFSICGQTQQAALGYLQEVPAPAGAPGRNTAPPSMPAIRPLGRTNANTNTSTTAFSSLPFGGQAQQQATHQSSVNQSIQGQLAVSSKSPGAILEGVWKTSQAVPLEQINPDHTFQMVCEMSHPLPYGCTNNDAEYTGLILGLMVAVRLGTQKLKAVGDSKLVVEQVNCNFAVKKESLRPLFHEVQKLLSFIPSCKVSHVLRAGNKKADALSNEAMDIAEAMQRAVQ